MRLIDVDFMMQNLGFENTEEERGDNVGEIITWCDVDEIPTALDINDVLKQLEYEEEYSNADF